MCRYKSGASREAMLEVDEMAQESLEETRGLPARKPSQCECLYVRVCWGQEAHLENWVHDWEMGETGDSRRLKRQRSWFSLFQRSFQAFYFSFLSHV